MNAPQWFENWFNSPYYHLLYNNRNHDEANYFITKLFQHFNFKPHDKVWDLACGKGRHALALHRLGLDVTGSDLSENNIREARAFEEKGLEFLVQDMRLPFRENTFDAVLNLFTSLGYFADIKDNAKVFANVSRALKPGGIFVVDFFNAKLVQANFKRAYEEQRGDIRFNISKTIRDRRIIKHIDFSCAGKAYYFEEVVSLLELSDFEHFAEGSGLKLQELYGNYSLQAFEASSSERLIMVFKKTDA